MASDPVLVYASSDDRAATVAAVRGRLKSRGRIVEGEPFQTDILYLDSFDWRLGRAGHALEARRTDDGHQLIWADRSGQERRLTIEVRQLPRIPADLEPGPLRDLLERLLAERVLMHAAHVHSTQSVLEVENKHGKTVLRVEIAEHTAHDGTGGRQCPLGTWIRLLPLRGYGKIARRNAIRIAKLEHCRPQEEDLLTAAARTCGIRPLDYSSKLQLDLQCGQPAWQALQEILRANLQGFRQNEDGMCNAIDIEFLHDFRVYVRRCRAALTDIRGVIDADALRPWREELRWLQQLTGESRDLDVYLNSLPAYRGELPAEQREGLEAFEAFLLRERQRAHLALTSAIRSERYRGFCAGFDVFIGGLQHGDFAGADFETPIGALSARLMKRAYKRVLRQGRSIDDDSPAESLHELRKLCKRLRYLLEFFQPLYPGDDIGAFIKALKGLQENLGNFQDYEVQADTLSRMSQRMSEADAAPAQTYLALGVLIQRLHDRTHEARREFAGRFARFDTAETRARFDHMCGQQR